LGVAYLKEDKKNAALASFEAAHRMQEQYPTSGYLQLAGAIDYHLGVLYREKGYTTRAIEAFTRVRVDDPAVVPANRELASIFEQSRRFDESIRARQFVLERSPRDAASLIALARMYKAQGDEALAKEYIDRVRSFYPNDPRIEASLRSIE
jgi:tetratricopeptide (TPR) repeat protein